MKDKPIFKGFIKGKDFRDEIPGYFPVIEILSDGQNFSINISEMCIDKFTDEVLERMVFILTDGIYRVRPDLRKQ